MIKNIRTKIYFYAYKFILLKLMKINDVLTIHIYYGNVAV